MNKERILVWRAQTLADKEAFSSLVKIHQAKIRAFLVRLSRHYDRADDLAQDTFLKAYEKLDTFSEQGSFSSWLFSIAYNCFLQQQRSVNRRDEVTADYSNQFELVADKYDSISAEQLDLENAMLQLNQTEAATITLCHSYGFSHQEVADILEIPLGTVKTNILRGKNKLRALLELDKNMEKVS